MEKLEEPMPDQDQSGSDSDYDEPEEQPDDEEDHLLIEMTAIAGSEDYIGSLTEVEIIFLPIKSLESVKLCHNLIQLTLIKTRTSSIEGIESGGHSLEQLTILGCGLEIMENCFAYLPNLREINLSENNIPGIQNLDNCLHLEKLFLSCNKIGQISGLSNNKKLKELHLQENLISKVANGSKIPNLQILNLSGNRIKNLNDINDIECLTQLNKLSFACEFFAPCPVAEIQGYRQYVLSVGAQSPYLHTLDSEYLSEDDINYAKNEFIESILELQKSLDQIEKSHRHSVLTIDSKLRENEQHLEDIEDNLVEELNHLKQDIEEGNQKLLSEFEKLKKLRSKSEEIFLKSLKEIEEKYENILNQVLATEEDKFNEWEKGSQLSVKAHEFEKEVGLCLVDVLYSTKGGVIYSEITKSSAEFNYLANMMNRHVNSEYRGIIQKAFHVNFSNIEFNEQILGPRMFIKLSIIELKEFLMNRKLPTFRSDLVDEVFPGEISVTEDNFAVIAVKAEKKISGTANPVMHYWSKNESDKLVIEFVMVISGMTNNDANVMISMSEDERIIDLISNSHNLPAESLAMIINLEREIFEKFADHERRVWGELDPNSLSKYKLQQDELAKLHYSLQSLKLKIENERSTQEKILKDMREALIGHSSS